MWLLSLLLAFQGSFYDQGLKALDDQQYQSAIDNFTQATLKEPDNYAAHFNLGLAYSMLGKDAQAIPEFQKTLALQPKLYPAELNLGICLLRSKQPAEAVPLLTDAVSQKPKEYRPNYYLAEALAASGKPRDAVTPYNDALLADPKSARAEYGLGHALLQADDLDQAAAHLRKAAEMDPALRDGLLELAAQYEKEKKSAEAAAIYRQFPDNAGAQEHLGQLQIDSGNPTDAIAAYEEAVKKSPTTANRAALATSYLLNKQPEKALPLAEIVLHAEPGNYDMRMLHGRILRDTHHYTQAAEDFAKGAQLRPDAVEAWSELSVMLVLSDNYPAALTALDRVAALHGEKPGHVYFRAIVLDKLKQVKPALESYQRFLSMSNGQSPDEEFKARQRVRILETELHKR